MRARTVKDHSKLSTTDRTLVSLPIRLIEESPMAGAGAGALVEPPLGVLALELLLEGFWG